MTPHQEELRRMLSTVKNKIRDSDLEPYLKTPYQIFVKHPYWILRRRLYPKTKRNIAGVDVEFVAEDSQDIEYDEFSSEESIIEEIVSDVNSNDVFYDIGSNIGLYSCVVSQKIDAKAVVAFEPSPPAYRKLRKNSELNGGFHHYQIAISDTDETVEFAVDVGDVQARMSTMNTHSATTDYRIQEVPSRTLSSMVEAEGVPSPTIVKIDVEGAEFKVLSGMEPLLDTVRILYCEIHHPVLDDFDTSRNEIIEYLEAFDFDVTTLHRRGQNEFVKATRMQG